MCGYIDHFTVFQAFLDITFKLDVYKAMCPFHIALSLVWQQVWPMKSIRLFSSAKQKRVVFPNSLSSRTNSWCERYRFWVQQMARISEASFSKCLKTGTCICIPIIIIGNYWYIYVYVYCKWEALIWLGIRYTFATDKIYANSKIFGHEVHHTAWLVWFFPPNTML